MFGNVSLHVVHDSLFGVKHLKFPRFFGSAGTPPWQAGLAGVCVSMLVLVSALFLLAIPLNQGLLTNE